MLKKSLFIGTFLLLFIGLNSHSYGERKPKPPKPPKPPREASTFSVDITGLVSGATVQSWQKNSKNGISYSNPHALLAPDINLSYFFTPSDKITDASDCFGGTTPILYGNIRKRRGMAEANFWIEAKAQNGIDRVVYILELFGLFRDPDDWLTFGDTIEVSGWEWKVANGQSDLENFSCRGVGDFPANMQFIDVEP